MGRLLGEACFQNPVDLQVAQVAPSDRLADERLGVAHQTHLSLGREPVMLVADILHGQPG